MKKTIQKFLLLSLMLGASSLEIAAQTCAPAPVNLISWWNADGSALDSRSRNNGILNGNTFAAGKVGQAFGINNMSGIADNAALNQQNSTLETWVMAQPYSCGGCSQFIAIKSGASFQGYGLGTNRQEIAGFGGGLRFTIEGLSDADLLDDVSIADGNFHHAAAIYDGATMKVYLDGTLAAQKPHFQSVNRRKLRLISAAAAADVNAAFEISLPHQAGEQKQCDILILFRVQTAERRLLFPPRFARRKNTPRA